MATTKKEYPALDAQPVVLYDLTDPEIVQAVPLIIGPRSQTPTGNVVQVQVGPGDIISNIPVIVPYDHHQIHEGEFYSSYKYTASLASGANSDTRVVVPSINTMGLNPVVMCPHFRFDVVASDIAEIFIYEGATFSNTGSTQAIVNHERNNPNISKMSVWTGVTTATTGSVLLWRGILFGSRTAAGDSDNAINEFVLKSGTEYLFRVTSGAAGNKVLERLNWYEDLGV